MVYSSYYILVGVLASSRAVEKAKPQPKLVGGRGERREIVRTEDAMRPRKSIYLPLLLPLLLLNSFSCISSNGGDRSGSIIFATLGRAQYAFDIYSVDIPAISLLPQSPPSNEQRLTDGQSVNYNGHFPTLSSSLRSLLSSPHPNADYQVLLYVTERNGSSTIYLDAYTHPSLPSPSQGEGRRSALEEFPPRLQIPLLRHDDGVVSMKDRPSIAGDYLIYVSTHERAELPRQSWAAVYSTHLRTGETRRLTPPGIADFSPAVSPSGEWTAVVSAGERGWQGEIEDLKADIYVFRTRDGSERVKIVDHGGWPTWYDDRTLFFHRQGDDGWWSVYKASIAWKTPYEFAIVERFTPPGFHAFTPVAGRRITGFVAYATRRPTSDFRHIEVLDISGNQLVEITRPISPNSHHFNPFLSPDGTRIGYHRCRGGSNASPLLLENLQSPAPSISLFRIDGSFPSFSPDGEQIAYVGFPGLYVVNRDGSEKRQVFPGTAFATAWDWKRTGVIYTSHGPTFASESTNVDIIAINLEEKAADGSGYAYKKLTTGGKNNAFPSPSPDGKWVVFRSGRSGHKNLYIMDAIEGEKASIRQLTDGPWTDTMCNWSPDGEWIAFASDRDNPGGGSFAIYFVRPDGSGLKKVVHSGDGGRTNHPYFSPDSKSLAFTTDYAGVSAEPIANPHHYQPYGDIFVARTDGSRLQRLTHNSYEDGTPAWGPKFMKAIDVMEREAVGPKCQFDDCHWLAIKKLKQKDGVPSSINATCGLP
ncbi:hypothetical protein ACLOJK_014056 [Asimina triloba]